MSENSVCGRVSGNAACGSVFGNAACGGVSENSVCGSVSGNAAFKTCFSDAFPVPVFSADADSSGLGGTGGFGVNSPLSLLVSSSMDGLWDSLRRVK